MFKTELSIANTIIVLPLLPNSAQYDPLLRKNKQTGLTFGCTNCRVLDFLRLEYAAQGLSMRIQLGLPIKITRDTICYQCQPYSLI